MKKRKKIKPALFFIIIFILSFTFVYNITTEPEPIDPNAQEIINTILIPFCETKGQFTETNLPKYFSQQFISYNNARQTTGKPTDISVAISENITALSKAHDYYEKLFIKPTVIQDCPKYFKNIKEVSFEKFTPNGNTFNADHRLQYSIKKSFNATFDLIKEDEVWKIRAIYSETFVSL